ncbi:MAG: TIGR04086 family membrane protein [Oscillospiraceae bacterium]
MRRKKNKSRFMPFAAGLAVGYGVLLLVSAVAALILSFFDGAAKTAGAAAVLALAIGSYFCGRTAGILRRRGGLKTGLLCGLLFSVLPVAMSLIFREFAGVMLPVKLILCVAFGAVGGVAGVNADEK